MINNNNNNNNNNNKNNIDNNNNNNNNNNNSNNTNSNTNSDKFIYNNKKERYIMIMMMKIMCKIKIINKKNIIKIKTKKQKKTKQTDRITTNKTLIYNRENTYSGREREKKNYLFLIYYIQIIKRLPCLISSVNITFIKTIRSIWYQYNSFCLKAFTVSAWSIIVISQSQIPLWSFCR